MTITIHNVYDTDESPSNIACAPFTFPGGEPHVLLSDAANIEGQYLWVDARAGTADEWMRTLAVLDAVKAMRPKRLGLFLPYFPGARQDRRQPGTPFTLRLYVDALARLGLDVVVTLDPHSEVLGAMMDVEAIPAHAVMRFQQDYDGLICPDAGAEKRVNAAAQELGMTRVVHARKCRNTVNGKLSGFTCDPLPTKGRYLVVDDLCDGGGTFLGLADIALPGAKLDLWVTHGIFSKGVDDLLARFGRIYTTDSFPFSVKHERLFTVKVHEAAANVMRRRIGT